MRDETQRKILVTIRLIERIKKHKSSGVPFNTEGYWDLVTNVISGILIHFHYKIICVYVCLNFSKFFFWSQNFMMAGVQVKEGEYTTTVYGMVSDFCVKFIVIK